MNIVTVILKYRSGLVNERHEEKTPLQIASHEVRESKNSFSIR